jgi:hypothetical protein
MLRYRVTPPGEDLAYRVDVERTACNYGKDRPWFRCPNTRCARRCRYLYSTGRYYLCRQCANLAYRKQQAHRNPTDEARAAGVSLWDEDERWMDWRKDGIRRLRYRLARTRPGSKRHRSLSRRLERLYGLQEAEYAQAVRILGPAGMLGELPPR